MSQANNAGNENQETPAEPELDFADLETLPELADLQPAGQGANEQEDWPQKVQDAENRALRAQAELENYRKRMRRDMEEDRKYASLPVVRDMLQVVDNLSRAMEAAEQSEGTAGLLEGVKMVAAQLDAVLQQHHCQRIQTLGQPFDPNLHEAVGQEPSSEYPASTVSRELRVGYSLHDRVIRPSQVFISTGPAAAATEPPPGTAGETS